MQSFLILQAIYLSQGDVPHITASAVSDIASAIFFPVTATLVLTTCLLVHKLNRLVEKLLDGFRTVAGGEIGAELEKIGSDAAVRVWDTGAGMTHEVQTHIFEKYYQGDTGGKKQGLGLGLSIVWRIVELSGGRIQVASQPQQDSSFTVYLPLDRGEA